MNALFKRIRAAIKIKIIKNLEVYISNITGLSVNVRLSGIYITINIKIKQKAKGEWIVVPLHLFHMRCIY